MKIDLPTWEHKLGAVFGVLAVAVVLPALSAATGMASGYIAAWLFGDAPAAGFAALGVGDATLPQLGGALGFAGGVFWRRKT